MRFKSQEIVDCLEAATPTIDELDAFVSWRFYNEAVEKTLQRPVEDLTQYVEDVIAWYANRVPVDDDIEASSLDVDARLGDALWIGVRLLGNHPEKALWFINALRPIRHTNFYTEQETRHILIDLICAYPQYQDAIHSVLDA